MSGPLFKGFTRETTRVNDIDLYHVRAGDGPAVVLLHGFPQTHALWHAAAPALTGDFTVVAPDLRGYGASGKPAGTEAYSFRHMAQDVTSLMDRLGHKRFHVVGHDRGGRVAHRLALDHSSAVLSLTVMDIVPTHHLLDDLSKEVAAAYYHWFFLAQPFPFPETMIGHDPDGYFESCLLGWGAATLDDFDRDALHAYRTAWRDPDTIRGMCADYRAALHYDFALDEDDLDKVVEAPALVLYGADGVMAKTYDIPRTWASRLKTLQAAGVAGGHFFVDQSPDATCAALHRFLTAQTTS